MGESVKRSTDTTGTRIATGNRLVLHTILPTADNAAKSAASARLAKLENAKRALATRIATGNRLELQMILPTAGNAGVLAQ